MNSGTQSPPEATSTMSFEIKECLDEIIQSSKSNNHILCRNALKNFENSMCTELNSWMILQLLPYENSNNNENGYLSVFSSSSSSSSFGSILLEILSNDECPESCRERASNCLLTLIQKIVSAVTKEVQTNCVSQSGELEISMKEHEEMQDLLCNLFQDYCPIFAKRFEPPESALKNNSNRNTPSKKSSIQNKPVEEVEEIRLVLVQIMLALVEALRAYGCTDSDMVKNQQNTNSSSAMTGASNILLRSLAKCVLLDPYPDLQRDGCLLLIQICHTFPTAVCLGAEMVLRPLVGDSIEIIDAPSSTFNENLEEGMKSFLTIDGGEREGAASSNEASDGLNQHFNVPSLAMPVVRKSFNSKDSLLRHRHAKTRSLALEALAEVMYCYPTSTSDTMSSPRDDGNCSGDGDGYGDGYGHGDRSKSDFNSANHNPDDAEIRLRSCGNTSKAWGDAFLNKLLSQVLPNLESVTPYDKSASVRIALNKTVSILLCLTFRCNLPLEGELSSQGTIATTAISRLIVLFTMGLSDESDKVAANAVSLCTNKIVPDMNQCLGKGYGSGDGKNRNDTVSLLVPFAGEVVDILLAIIAGIISVDHKQRHLNSLAFVLSGINLAQDYACAMDTCTKSGSLWGYSRVLKAMIVLCESFSSDEKGIFGSAMKCANALGGNVDSRRVALTMVLRSLRGDSMSSGNSVGDKNETCTRKSIIISSPNQCASALCFLSGLLRGGSSQMEKESSAKEGVGVFESSLIDISSTIVHERLLQYLHKSTEFAYCLLDTCGAVIDLIVSSGRNSSGTYVEENSAIRDALLCCIYLNSCELTKARAMGLICSFAEGLSGVEDASQLLDIYFDDLLKLITKELRELNGTMWEFGDFNIKAFDSLLRTCHGKTVGNKMGEIGPILESHLSGETISSPTTSSELKKDVQLIFQTKLFIMALVQSIVSNPDLPKIYLQPFAEALLTNAVIPNLVWQVGSHASALRKLSAAVLFSILQGGGASNLTICKLCPELLPILKSTLGDDDGIVRELVSASLSKIFEALPAVLGEQAIDKLYPELMKGLDDSNENVRFASCDALKNFLRCAPAANYRGTAIEYMVENLFVHLDDPNLALQEKVYNVLAAAVPVDSAVVAKNAEASIFSHRNSKYCKKLLKLALDE